MNSVPHPRQGLGDAFSPRLAVLRDRSRIRVSAFGAIAIAWAVAWTLYFAWQFAR